MVPGAGIRRPEDNFLQHGLTGICLFYIQVIVANQAEKNAVAVDAVVTHHFPYGYLPGASALVNYILYKIFVTSHNN